MEPRATRSSRSAGSCVSRAARSPRGPTGPGSGPAGRRRPHHHRRPSWTPCASGLDRRRHGRPADPGGHVWAAEDDRAGPPHAAGGLAGRGRPGDAHAWVSAGSAGPRACGPRSRPRTAGGPVTCSTGTSPPPAPEPGLGHRLHLRAHLGRVRLRRVHRRRFAQRIVGWHAATTKDTDLVLTPLRMALWHRDRDGHPIVPRRLIHHSDARRRRADSTGRRNTLITEVCDGTSARSRCRRRRRVRGGSGRRIGRCGRRCARRAGRSRRVLCSGSSGG